MDDTGDTTDNTGTLTSTTITGLGMAVGITYGTVEHLVISLGSGNDTFTINSTHGAATDPFQEDTTLNTGAGTDTVNINDVTDMLFVNGQADADTINVNGTRRRQRLDAQRRRRQRRLQRPRHERPVERARRRRTTTRNVTSVAPTLPAGPRTTPTGSIDAINALLDVDGGAGTLDTLNVDDSAAARSNDKTGTLTVDFAARPRARGRHRLHRPRDAEHLARVRQQHLHDQQHARRARPRSTRRRAPTRSTSTAPAGC